MLYNKHMLNPAIIVPILVFMIPIIAILTSHQRKMAEIYAHQAHVQPNPEIAALRQEIQELKQLIHQQAIAMDNVTSGRVGIPQAPQIHDRMTSGGY
jgi:hypothetical protein